MIEKFIPLQTPMEIVHFLVGTISSLVCLVLGLLLLYIRNVALKKPYRPRRYISARRALGWAYIIIGVFSMVLLFTYDVRNQVATDFFPLSGLIISISQIILFTVAFLGLFNSRLVNGFVVNVNILPIGILLVAYTLFIGHELIQLHIRQMLFLYYLLQLVVYTIVFIIERRKYLLIIEDYFDIGKMYEKYSCKGVAVLYFSAIGIGIWALASYFFTTQLQETIFIASYTVFYIIVAWYYLNYSKLSSRIQDVTTPELWRETEEFSREEHRKERKDLFWQ